MVPHRRVLRAARPLDNAASRWTASTIAIEMPAPLPAAVVRELLQFFIQAEVIDVGASMRRPAVGQFTVPAQDPPRITAQCANVEPLRLAVRVGVVASSRAKRAGVACASGSASNFRRPMTSLSTHSPDYQSLSAWDCPV